ncbi:MAG: hypothetical protein KGZ81_14300 [Flavobacteriales bacterium]|nr:hypothetical protein [Flavobacteriales bacterium]
MLQGILFLGLGIFFVVLTSKDGKVRKRELTTSYVMHLKGYLGGIVLIIIDILNIIREIS